MPFVVIKILPLLVAIPQSSSSYSQKTGYIFATLSVRLGAPVFICPAFTATAISAIVVSSVSPLRCDITAV